MNEATQAVVFGSDKKDWGTPKAFYGLLDNEFHFDVDVCAHADNAKSMIYYDESLDCLKMDWDLGARYIRLKAGFGFAKGEECGCVCHYRNHVSINPDRPLLELKQEAHEYWLSGICECARNCKRLPIVGYMNPPYGDSEQPCVANCKKKKCVKRGHCTSVYIPGIADFMEKAFEESLYGHTLVSLVPSRVDTAWWNTWVQGKADEVRHIVGRLVFEDGNGNEDSAPFPTSVVIYRPPYDRRHTHVTTMEKPDARPRPHQAARPESIARITVGSGMAPALGDGGSSGEPLLGEGVGIEAPGSGDRESVDEGVCAGAGVPDDGLRQELRAGTSGQNLPDRGGCALDPGSGHVDVIGTVGHPGGVDQLRVEQG